MPNRVDNHVPEHLKATVTSGNAILGSPVQLSGAVSVSIQTTCTDGAAGTLTVLGSNQLGKTAFWVEVATQTVAANQSVVLTNSLIDDVTGMHVMRCRFTPTAGGNVTTSVNVRRTDY